jgi:DNA-binding transcriptional LysR family regulator
MNLAQLDLNLLLVFEAVLAERSITRAGAHLGLSQPAVSNALARLRSALGDPLIVRAGTGMEPTPRGLELAPAIRHALTTIRSALAPPDAFDPAQASQVFRIATADDMELTLLPNLLERMKRSAPGIDLEISRQLGGAESALRTGGLDLFIGAWFDVPSAFRSHLLRTEGFMCIARKGHPAIASELSLPIYMQLGHIVVSPTERPGSVIDAVLQDQDLGRRVVLKTSHFLIAPLVVARTDLIATLPRAVARACAEFLELALYPPPIDAPGFPVRMVWHPRVHDHAPHRWLREQVMQAATDADGW